MTSAADVTLVGGRHILKLDGLMIYCLVCTWLAYSILCVLELEVLQLLALVGYCS